MKHQTIYVGLFLFMIFIAARISAQPAPVNEPAPVAVIRQAPEVTAQANFNVGAALVGDAVTYTLTFRWVDDGTTYRITPAHLDPQGLDVVNVATTTESSEDNNVRYKVRSYVYELRAVVPGKAMVEALTISYYADAMPEPYFVSLPAMSINIAEVKQPLLKDKRLLIAGAGVVVLVFVVIGIIIVKRVKGKKPDQILPQEKIAADLKAAQALLDRGEYNKVVEQLEVTARFFLAEILRVKNSDGVSSEGLGHDEAFRALEEKHRAAIIKIFKRAEEARYSGISYERHEVRMLLDDLTAAVGVTVK
jgi:hypothetical protein